uniref:SAM-dependent chlorinase/fluorinase n=1 Tax=Thermofilum pendens TaxID=2269 RepID=A0A7J3X9C7_THEPE
MPLVAFLSDFGYTDYYVAAVKAVIKRVCPVAEVVDVSHGVRSWSLLDGCYTLSCCFDDFPEGTVFLAVVDPGVGTPRRGLVVRSARYWFVGPDNGLLTCVASRDPPFRAWAIEKVPYARKRSYTFHGRDVFAPVAAYIACGGSPEEVGREVADPVALSLWEPEVVGNVIRARAVHVDNFGNVALNVGEELLGRLSAGYGTSLRVRVPGGEHSVKIVRTFGEVEPGEAAAVINSCGFLELVVNQGSASRKLGVNVEDPVEIEVER